jgi:hypothetical protein
VGSERVIFSFFSFFFFSFFFFSFYSKIYFSGALWMGTAIGDLVTDGVLYRVDPAHNSSVTAMLHNISTPGGMAWSHDKKTFFFIDSKNSRVRKGGKRERRGWVEFAGNGKN